VPTRLPARSLIALLCLAALLFTALAPPAAGLPFALLVPVWLFFGVTLALIMRRDASSIARPLCPALRATGTRAPPTC
jgi:hypothetical protein